MTPEQKAWIDNATYEDLFRKWRFAPIGDPLLQGEAGDHFVKMFNKRRSEIGSEEHTRISKRIGWDP